MSSQDSPLSPAVCWWETARTDETAHMTDEQFAEERARHLVQECQAVEDRQRSLHQLNLWNATLYSNRQLAGFHWGWSEPSDQALTPCNLLTENLVLSIGDAMLSRAASSPTRVAPTPRGANWTTYRLVKKLDRWLAGVWRDLNMEDLMMQVFLDAYISGTGTLRVDWDPHRERLTAERVFFDNVVVDNTECANAPEPRVKRIRQVVPAATIEERYGVKLSEAEKSKSYTQYRMLGHGWVPVVEAWRLPGADGSAGRHTAAACGRILLDEPWTADEAPLVHFHWSRRTTGWYRGGGVEQVVPYQVRLNEINEVIRDAQDLMARPRILVHTGSNVDVNAIDNVVGRIIRYTGVEPKALNWDAVSGDLLNERDRQVRTCFEFFGMSQMTAQAQLPAGVRLDSSAGVREFRVQEDQRFLDLWRRFEQTRVDAADVCIDVMSRVGAGHKTTWSAGGRFVTEEIAWEDVKELTRDLFTWSLEPVSVVNQAPGARMDTLNTWVAQQYITPERAAAMSGNPDLEDIQQMETASRDDIKRVVERAESGEFEPPDPTQNLVYGLWLFTQNLARIRGYKGVPASVFEAHHRWLRQALALQQPVVEDLPPPETEPLAPPVGAMSPMMAATGPDSLPMGAPAVPV